MRALKPTYTLLLLLLFPGSLTADHSKIMVINSDASVEKYEAAQMEFKSAFAYPIKDVNLGEKEWKLQEIEDLLFDEYPDLIYCIGTKAYVVANRFLSEKKIVFSSIINWKRLPVNERMFGVSNELPPEMEIMLFRYTFPGVRKIGVLYSEEYNGQWVNQASARAKEMGVEIIGRAVEESKQAISVLKKSLPDMDALWLISDPVILSDKKVFMQLFTECDARKKPVFSYQEAFAKQGAVLIVSVDDATIGRQAAKIAMDVLSGEKMTEKVQFPAGSQIIMNLNKVKEYRLEYNADALASVNQLIE
jgi:putative ABC transport system substrate-binding protein